MSLAGLLAKKMLQHKLAAGFISNVRLSFA
jgi:uncharacterized membrane protein YeaQ/YmgE (transglycosylase-associated protein family)